MDITQAEKREAFDSWDRYIPGFKETIAKMTRRPEVATGPTLLDNPLVSLIYADGFLNGRQSGDKPEGVKQLRQRNRDLTAMIEELVWAMHLWGQDEDSSIHPDADRAFWAACKLVGVAIEEDTGGEVVRFTDLDWTQRQRDQWRQRQEG